VESVNVLAPALRFADGIEAALLVVALLIAWRWRGSSGLRSAGRPGGLPHWIAVGLLTLAARAALLPITGVPHPLVADEYAYLLAADTYAQGRLTNPTHQAWRFFETPHVIHQPSYQAKYPPAQGLALAAGQWLGHPWIGVWLTTGAMCAALTWMLEGWLAPRWALYGGLLAALRWGVFGYWMNSYWGGSMAALGGALVLGAAPRRNGWLLGAGAAILANSRPYEGLVLMLAAGVAAMALLPRQGWLRMAATALPVMAVAAAATLYYQARVTGSPWRIPYFVHEERYAAVPVFLWQAPKPMPEYHHWSLAQLFADADAGPYRSGRTPVGFVKHVVKKLGVAVWFYFGVALVPALLALRWRGHKERFVLLATALSMVGILPVAWTLPHYFAPLTGLFLLLAVQGLRRLGVWRPAFVRLLPVVIAGSLLPCAAGATFFERLEHDYPRCCLDEGNLRRAQIVDELRGKGGRHLVLVRYSRLHNPHWEWVANEADLDRARIIWARSADAASDRLVMFYFPDRQAWVVEVRDTDADLRPYARY
jgi:hypothetical protein